MITVRKLSVYDDNCYIVVVGSGTMEDGNMQEQVNRNLSDDKSCMPSFKQEVCLSFLPSSWWNIWKIKIKGLNWKEITLIQKGKGQKETKKIEDQIENNKTK